MKRGGFTYCGIDAHAVERYAAHGIPEEEEGEQTRSI